MKSGIYHIICKKTGRTYVGQSNQISVRWAQHLNDLKEGKHVNTLLQEDFILNGEDGFYFKVREYCHESLLNYAEANEIDVLLGMGIELYNNVLPNPIKTISVPVLDGPICEDLYELCRVNRIDPAIVIHRALRAMAERELRHLDEFYCIKTKIPKTTEAEKRNA